MNKDVNTILVVNYLYTLVHKLSINIITLLQQINIYNQSIMN